MLITDCIVKRPSIHLYFKCFLKWYVYLFSVWSHKGNGIICPSISNQMEQYISSFTIYRVILIIIYALQDLFLCIIINLFKHFWLKGMHIYQRGTFCFRSCWKGKPNVCVHLPQCHCEFISLRVNNHVCISTWYR